MDEKLLNLIKETAEENSKERELEVRTLRAPRKGQEPMRYTASLTNNKTGQVWLGITKDNEIGIVRGSTKELEKAREQITRVLSNSEQELSNEERVAAGKILLAIDAKIIKNRQIREKREQNRLANQVKTVSLSDIERMKNEYQEMVRDAVKKGEPYPSNFDEINDSYELLKDVYDEFVHYGIDTMSISHVEMIKEAIIRDREKIKEDATRDLTDAEVIMFREYRNNLRRKANEDLKTLEESEAKFKEGSISEEELERYRDNYRRSQAEYNKVRFEKPRRVYTVRQAAVLRRKENTIKILNEIEQNAKLTPREGLYRRDVETILSEKVAVISREDIYKLYESKQISETYYNELMTLLNKEGVDYLSIEEIESRQRQLLDEMEKLSIPTEADIEANNKFIERVSKRFKEAGKKLDDAIKANADEEIIERLQEEYNDAFTDYEIYKYSVPKRLFNGKGEEADKARYDELQLNSAGLIALKGLSREVEARYLKIGERNQIVDKVLDEPVEVITVEAPNAQAAPVKTVTVEAATVEGDSSEEKPEEKKYVIAIPENPKAREAVYDEKAIVDEIDALNQRTLEEYYSDSEFRDIYNKVLAEYLSHRVEVEDKEKGYKYKTIEDYETRKEDEEFLLLDGYKARLERLSRYKAGDNSVYPEDEEEKKALIRDDKIYLSTLNHKFDKHKYTQRDLATLGKYGEKAPYIPEQKSLVGKGFRVVGNAFIGIRNFFSPVYRFIGKNVAQPLHKAITGGKGGTPFDSHPYHNFVARRDHFTSVKRAMLMIEDGEEKAKAKEEKREPRELTGLQKLRRGLALYFEPRWNALVKRKEGNEAVLRARFFDNYTNVREKYINIESYKRYSELVPEYEKQIKELQDEILAHPDAENIIEAEKAMAAKASSLDYLNKQIAHFGAVEQTETKPVDAISERQHAIASKEVNTFRVTAIKGVLRLAFVKFVGPNIRKWLTENITKTETIHNEAVTTKDWTMVQDAVYEKTPVTVDVMDMQRPLNGVMSANTGRSIDLMYSVSGGERKIQKYAVQNNDFIGAIFQEGEHGMGFSDVAGISPNVLTGRTLPETLIDAATGRMKQGLTVQEIIDTFPAGTINTDTLDKLYVGISSLGSDGKVTDRGWARLGDLMELVQTPKIVDYTDTLVKAAQYDWVERVIKEAEDVTNTVVNTRAVNALMGTGAAALYAATAYDAYENLRRTDTKVKADMSFWEPRESDFRKGEVEYKVPRSKLEYKKMKKDKDEEETK